MPITTSTAPTMPVEAANTAAIDMVASASPPGKRPSQSCIALNRRSPMPDFSSMAPMKDERRRRRQHVLGRYLQNRVVELDADEFGEKRQPEQERRAKERKGDGNPAKDKAEQGGKHQRGKEFTPHGSLPP